MTVPSTPDAIISRIAGRACEPSDWKPIWQATPAAATPSAIRRNSPYEGAGGFSSNRCTPLSAATSARSVWVGMGVQITAIRAPVESSRAPKSADCSGARPATSSDSPGSSDSSKVPKGPKSSASSAGVRGSGSQMPASRTSPSSWSRRMFRRCQRP